MKYVGVPIKKSHMTKIVKRKPRKHSEILSKQSVWDKRYLSLAFNISEWSKDPSTKCGAVIVNSDNQILGTGYNGFAKGVRDNIERLEERSIKYPLTIHAELNAVLNAQGRVLKGSTIYVTHPPCSNCISLLAQVGIKRVVHQDVHDERFNKAWNTELTSQIAKEVKIEICQINME